MKPFRKTKYYSFSLQRFLKWFQHSSPAWFSPVSKPLWWVVPEELLYPSKSWGTGHHAVRGHIAQIKQPPRLIWIQQVLAGMLWPPCRLIFLHLRIIFLVWDAWCHLDSWQCKHLTDWMFRKKNSNPEEILCLGQPTVIHSQYKLPCTPWLVEMSMLVWPRGWIQGVVGPPQYFARVQGLGRFPYCWPVGTHQQRGCWTSKTRSKCWLMEPCKHWSEQLVNHYYLEVSRKIRTNMKQRWNKQLLYGQKWIFSFHSK